MNRAIKVLIVDDSALVRSLLKQGLSQFSDIEIIGEAANPYEASDCIENNKPDVITLDIEMPKMNGVEFLRHLMAQVPIPVIMVSSFTEKGQQITMDALSFGAIDFVTKPQGNSGSSFAKMIRNLHSKITMAATTTPKKGHAPTSPYKIPETTKHIVFKSDSIIAIGASTGGTEAIKDILPHLPATMPPILITQHMPKGFTSLFAKRLNTISHLKVIEAEDGLEIVSGTVYIAPGGKQMKIIKNGGTIKLSVTDSELVNGHRPSVEFLFRSLLPYKSRVISILLTGMGKDGSEALHQLKRSGATTIAQDENSCVVFGMPGEAIRLGGATMVLPLKDIAHSIIQHVKE